ncbi:ABC transporter substrate-binding protein [Actinacidiphila oryziradicis]|jgi:ABC-type glycerol-3-phosphate transport system substrate-binding protein|uniref:Extracellular solute-binding protein n=1 Tax=Actinacidiphila oryziradicis TaxID=2571141 RepID=A0A4U0RUG5_9ACTN|nr:extracellular solute-binding protein [Actinacidiphila oryziradicis]TJZ99117.1 extracellular solute-binding protein [Actinacidiphila oryziradicis]
MKRIKGIIAVTCAALLALSGCSSAAYRARTSGGTLASKPAGTYPTGPVKLVIWWWGEQEVAGAKGWLADTVAAYEKLHPNVKIETVLQTTDSLIPAFQAAAAANQGPDIQYFWGGINSQEPAWAGHVLPISDYIPASELKHYLNAATEDSYKGKILTAPWYVNPQFPVLVRKDVLAAHGLKTPTTWSDLLSTCDKLNAAGITTLAGGVKDGWFGGWLYSMIDGQLVSSSSDVTAAVTGQQKFTDPMHADWWQRLQETVDHHCWNADINSQQLYQAQQQWVSGKAAMTITAGTDAPNFVKKVGADKVQITTMPKIGNGPYAGKMGTTSQTVGITPWTKYPKVDADFIEFMHSPQRLQAWYDKTGSMPADDRFDMSKVTDPVKRQLFQMALNGAPYLENYIPAALDSNAVFTNVQLVLQGKRTADQAAADMQSQVERLRLTDRSLVNDFKAWKR